MTFQILKMDKVSIELKFGRNLMDLKQYVSEVQDWPKPGVSFKDITTIMDNGKAYGYATDQIVGMRERC